MTPAGHASAWAIMSNEQPQIHRALAAAGIALHTLSRVVALRGRRTDPGAISSPTPTRLPCQSLVIVGARFANDFLYQTLSARAEELKRAGILSVTRDRRRRGAGCDRARGLQRAPLRARTRRRSARLAYRRDAPLSRASDCRCHAGARDWKALHERAAVRPGALRVLSPRCPRAGTRSAQVFALEKERIFCREWLCVARAEELAEPGAFRVLEVLGESILLVRNREGQLRAFYNVCRHRGSRLCREPPAAGAAACSAAGSPAAASPAPTTSGPMTSTAASSRAPYLTGEPGFDKSLFSLYPVGVECWGGFVFVQPDPRAGARRSPRSSAPSPSASRATRWASCASGTRSATRSPPTGK